MNISISIRKMLLMAKFEGLVVQHKKSSERFTFGTFFVYLHVLK